MKTEIERCKEALAGAKHALEMVSRYPKVIEGGDYISAVLIEIDEILYPPPETEDVEVAAWMLHNPNDGKLFGPYEHEPNVSHYLPIKLTGTYKRPIPQPVEKSVSVEVEWFKPAQHRALPIARGESTNFEWEKLLGQKGTLTFTWLEPQK